MLNNSRHSHNRIFIQNALAALTGTPKLSRYVRITKRSATMRTKVIMLLPVIFSFTDALNYKKKARDIPNLLLKSTNRQIFTL